MANKWSILDLRASWVALKLLIQLNIPYSTSNSQVNLSCLSDSTRVGTQPCLTQLVDESRVGTPTRQSLVSNEAFLFFIFSPKIFQYYWQLKWKIGGVIQKFKSTSFCVKLDAFEMRKWNSLKILFCILS